MIPDRPKGLQSKRGTLWNAVGFVQAAGTGAVRDLVWSELQSGMMRLRGLDRSTRALVRLVFTLFALVVFAMLFGDVWRGASPLEPIWSSAASGRGALLPRSLLPATLFLLSVAWSLVLAGALHSHPLFRWGILLVYAAAVSPWAALGATEAGADRLRHLLYWLPLLAVVVWFALPRRRTRPVLDWVILLALTTLTLALAQARIVESWRESGIGLVFANTTLTMSITTLLISPLLLLLGLDIADFTQRASRWTGSIVQERLPLWVAGLTFALFFAWRAFHVGGEALDRAGRSLGGDEALTYAGALGELLLVGSIGAIVVLFGKRGRRGTPTADDSAEAAEECGPWLVLAASFPTAVAGVILLVAMTAQVAFVGSGGDGLSAFLGEAGNWILEGNTAWRLIVAGVALVAAVPLALKGQGGVALYAGIFGALEMWHFATRLRGPLGVLGGYGSEALDVCLLALLGAATLAWLARRRLTGQTIGALLFLLIVTALLQQRDFIENPFSPFLGFAGIVFVAFSLIWDLVTRGSWANEDSRALPRVSRIFLYLGYVLFAATMLNWALGTHDLEAIGQMTGGGALLGFDRFGMPLIYAMFLLTLTNPDGTSATQQA